VSLRAESVDPRDVCWEVNETSFRVYFWSSAQSRCREFAVSEVRDVSEVLAWADANAVDDEVRTIYAVVARPKLGLVRLDGPDSPC
jgi:hypothetical protein